MKKTIIEWYCDKCGCKVDEVPRRAHRACNFIEYDGTASWYCAVTVDFVRNEVDIPVVCNKCQIEALEDVLHNLKKEQGK